MANPSGSSESFASLFEQSPSATRGRQRRYHSGEQVEVTVVAIARELNLPIRYVGVGEKLGDLLPFDPEKFIESLFEK